MIISTYFTRDSRESCKLKKLRNQTWIGRSCCCCCKRSRSPSSYYDQSAPAWPKRSAPKLVVNCNYSCKSSSGSVAPLEITATKPTAAADREEARGREREREREREEKLQELPVLLLVLELKPLLLSLPGVFYNQFHSRLPRPVQPVLARRFRD